MPWECHCSGHWCISTRENGEGVGWWGRERRRHLHICHTGGGRPTTRPSERSTDYTNEHLCTSALSKLTAAPALSGPELYKAGLPSLPQANRKTYADTRTEPSDKSSQVKTRDMGIQVLSLLLAEGTTVIFFFF